MGNRRQRRVRNVIPVRIWGMDSMGKAFIELAHTLDISQMGVRIGGFNTIVNVGDVVGLQYRHLKSRYEVAWVGRPSSAKDKQIGVKCLDAGKDIFAIGREMQGDDYEPPEVNLAPRTSASMRRHERFSVRGGVQIFTMNPPVEVWAELNDLSTSGCYLTTPSPATLLTEVKLLLQVKEALIKCDGTVRTSHPRVGMGIEFTQFDTIEDEERVKQVIERIKKGEFESRQAQPPAAKPDVANISSRLLAAGTELNELEELIKCSVVSPEILRDFNEAASRVRTTSWALQQWIELQDKKKSPFPVVTYLNTERIRLATKLCQTLHTEMKRNEVPIQKAHLSELLEAVEELFTHLAGIDFKFLAEQPLPPPEVIEVAVGDSSPEAIKDAMAAASEDDESAATKRGKHDKKHR